MSTEEPIDEQDDALIGRALRLSLFVFLGIGLLAAGGAWLLREREVPQEEEFVEIALPEVREAPADAMPRLMFTNITSVAGIDFVHCNGATGEKLLPETMGGGCAFFDYDKDGDQDLLLVNSCAWPWDEDQPPATTALYANNGEGFFTNVTTQAGLDRSLYGMGVAVGDYDNDGQVDLFISAVGKNRLFRNEQGVFTEVTVDAGVAGSDDAWSTSCGWLDYDNDGDLDLLVGNYVRWSREIDQVQDFRLTGIGRAYGPPFSFEGSFPYLYRNNGDGTFDDVSSESGVQQTNLATGVPLAKTLGVSPYDVNGDGWIDFVLANDTVRNLLFINQTDGTFVESGIEAGLAFDSSGKARGAMGVDTARFRDDESLGVAIANFANEMTALYVSYGDATFTDDAIPSGLGPPTRGDLSFGLFFFDADLDGRLDLLAANGHLEDDIQVVQTSQSYRQPAALFWNAGDTGPEEFARVPSEEFGSDLARPLVGRGATYADIDGDGDLDVLITQIAGPPALLRNDQATGHHWLRLKLVGSGSNRDAIGASVEVTAGGRTIVRTVRPTRSYLSQVETLLTVGLGDIEAVDRVVVTWPGGSEQEVLECQLDRTTIVEQR